MPQSAWEMADREPIECKYTKNTGAGMLSGLYFYIGPRLHPVGAIPQSRGPGHFRHVLFCHYGRIAYFCMR